MPSQFGMTGVLHSDKLLRGLWTQTRIKSILIVHQPADEPDFDESDYR
jgi:hypothetical protein